MIYTTIIHDVRRLFDLSCNDYCIADIIDKYAYNANNPSGWCFATKETIAFAIGVTKQTVLTSIDRLIFLGLVEKHEHTKHLRTTKKWTDATQMDLNQLREMALPSVKKLYQDGKDFLPEDGKEILPYNKSIYNEIYKENIDSRKEKFFNQITEYKNSNPTKYPKQLYNDFFTYWTELNKSKTKFRFEAEKFFDIARRLATFWTNTAQWKKDQYWSLDKIQNDAANKS